MRSIFAEVFISEGVGVVEGGGERGKNGSGDSDCAVDCWLWGGRE